MCVVRVTAALDEVETEPKAVSSSGERMEVESVHEPTVRQWVYTVQALNLFWELVS